jgi:hypothetical protein
MIVRSGRLGRRAWYRRAAAMLAADLRAVFVEAHVADPVQAVFDAHGGDLQGAPLGAAVPALAGATSDRGVPPRQAGKLRVQTGLVALDGT